MEWLDRYGYAAAVLVMAIGLYVAASRGNLIKKLVGLNIFQTAVFLLYITAGKSPAALRRSFTTAARPTPTPCPMSSY